MKTFIERQLVRLLLSRGGPLLQKAVTAAAAAAVTWAAGKTGIDVAALGLNEAVFVGIIWAIIDTIVTKLPANVIKDHGKEIQRLLNTYGRGTSVKVDGYVGPVTVAAAADELLAKR